MSIVSKVFQSMREGYEYDVATLSVQVRSSESSVAAALKCLCRGGAVVEMSGKRFIRDRKYRTKQKQLFR